jgi:hypothetical protein
VRTRFWARRRLLAKIERAAAAGIDTKLGNHSFRATGITAYLKNGGTLQRWRTMPRHARPSSMIAGAMRWSRNEVERIVI